MTPLEWLVIPVGILAGGIAAIAGFGVGSLLTPLLTPSVGAKRAVALVSLPHAIATALRLWGLRRDISFSVLKGFGVASALGSLMGGYLYTTARAELLAIVLGVLLIGVGSAELAGLTKRFRLTGAWAWEAGAVSGLFGGLVGNQGGVRSAGLLGLGLSPRAFVATAAAIALVVDAVRVPIYLSSQGAAMVAAWPVILAATLGVVIGTFTGYRVLLRMPPETFRRVVGVVLLALGVWMVAS